MNIVITGHRPNKLGNDYELKSPLIQAIKSEIKDIIYELAVPDMTFITGMALGIDTLFAQMAVELNIPFIAAIPCKNQDGRWLPKSKEIYRFLINHPLCTKVYTNNNQPYDFNCMTYRNRWMIDQLKEGDFLIAVYDGSYGGTSSCVNYAKQQNKKIIEINPKLIRL